MGCYRANTSFNQTTNLQAAHEFDLVAGGLSILPIYWVLDI
jgi:hypothetical protein